MLRLAQACSSSLRGYGAGFGELLQHCARLSMCRVRGGFSCVRRIRCLTGRVNISLFDEGFIGSTGGGVGVLARTAHHTFLALLQVLRQAQRRLAHACTAELGNALTCRISGSMGGCVQGFCALHLR